MPRYLVLKELPQGQQPGTLVDLHDDVGRVFLLVGAVRLADAESEPEMPSAPARRRYARRDLTAVED